MHEVMESNSFLRADDFSGCSCRYYLVQEYFASRSINEPLKNIEFMNFLEEKERRVTKEPIVFHRVFPSPSLWQNTVADHLKKLSGMLWK